MKFNNKAILGLAAFTIVAALSFVLLFDAAPVSGAAWELPDYTTDYTETPDEDWKFAKNIMIWFMLMMIAFLMMFIKKYEWGVALAVVLSAAGSFIAYLAIQDFYFGEAWNQDLLIRGAICAITLVIAIGVFLGTIKSWQYLLVGFLFAPVYALVEWTMGNLEIFTGVVSSDPGGSMLVHMAAAYFGLGVAMAIRDKRAFEEPMFTTTHSVTFVWLGSLVLWVLWPGFVSALLPGNQVAWATMTCYLAGVGSIISAYVVCQAIQGKVNPLVYTYALLAGPVAIGAPLIVVGPWGALIIGIVAGIVSALSFIYLQPWLCGKLGVLDNMGVHNLHGMGGWVGVFATVVIFFGVGNSELALTNLAMAFIVVGITVVLGLVSGLIIRLTRGEMDVLFDDDPDFIKNEKPA